METLGSTPSRPETLEPLLTASAAAAAAPDIDAEANRFTAGDLVWAGEVKSHPWWPGQVLDPSQAPDHARSGHRPLVAYFGDGGGFAWCDPSRLKPFAAAEFREIVNQNRAKSFVAAVRDAIAVIGRCLQFDLTCHCIPVEARVKASEPQADANAIANYTPAEFLDRLRGVARDVLSADMLEATMVCSWGLAFGKGSFSSGSFAYHLRREISDLVDEMDIDATPLDSVREEMGQKEPSISRNRMAKNPGLSEEDLYHKRKKRSMAKLIAEMNLDAVEVRDVEEEKAEIDTPNRPFSSMRKKGGKVSEPVNAQLGSAEAVKETCSGVGRRERKKSKYLSPPYTYLSSHTKLSASSTESETPKKAPEASWPLHSNSKVITKCTYSLLRGEEEDKRSPAFQIDSMHAPEILAEFLLTALNPLHLKWNRLAKTVKGFLAVYRSSVYVNGSDFDTYQKHLDNSVSIDEMSASKDKHGKLKDRISDGKTKRRKSRPNEETQLDCHVMLNHSEGKRTERKRKMRKDGADGVSPLDLDQDLTYLSEQGKSWPKRKPRKDGIADEALLGSVLDATNGSEQGKAGLSGIMGKDAAFSKHLLDLNFHATDDLEASKTPQNKKRNGDGDIGQTVGSGHEPINTIEAGKTRKKMIKNKEVSDSKTPTELGPELVDHREGGRLGQRNGEVGLAGESLMHLGGEVSNGMEAGKIGQTRQNDTTTYRGSTALLLTFAPDFTLPSKEYLVSTFRKYGDLIEAETELLRDSCCARIVFVKSTDAKKALDNRDKSGAFGSPAPSYHLCHMPGNFSSPAQQIPTTKPPLPYIRNNLEIMISTLTGSSSPEKDAGSSDGFKPEARENLVGEMKGLLKKVDKMLKGPCVSPSSSIYK